MKKDFLKTQLMLISPSEEELEIIRNKTKKIVDIISGNLRKSKTSAEVFVGGSSAKNTMIKKNKYDVDIFVRFDSGKHRDADISNILAKCVPKSSARIHGSRDYFSFKEDNIEFEIIPVLKIKKPEEAKNITDLSFFHVKYIHEKIEKNKKLADEIRLAKAFLYFQECYGAESYINGFSGYAVELLIAHYKSFMNFIKAIAKANTEEKIIIDSERLFKNKQEIMTQLNESKLNSPMIVIDPTHKERNALAALSLETFIKFQNSCRRFLKNPSEEFFKLKDKESLFEKRYKDILKLELSTIKQAGDIAGTKLKKFYGFFICEFSRYFDVKNSEFIYDEKQNKGKIIVSAKPKKEIIFPGPPIKMQKPLAEFKKEHRKIKIVKGRAFAYEKNNLDFEKFLKDFQNEKGKVIADMDIEDMKIIDAENQ